MSQEALSLAPSRRSVTTAVATRVRRPAMRALAAYLVVAALVVLAPVLRTGLPGLLGPSGDPQQFTWFTAWTPHALLHGTDPLLTDRLGAPVGVNLGWNALMPLAGLAVWPVTATLGAAAGYDALLVLGIALSAWCMRLVVRRHVDHESAAFAAGLLYGVSPFMVAHALGHPNLVLAMAPPLAFMLLEDGVVRQRITAVRAGVLLGLLSALQLLVWEEVLVTMAVGAAVGLAVLAVTHRAQVLPRLRRASVVVGVAVLVFAALAAAPLAVQLLGPHRVQGTIQARGMFVTDLLGPVVPTDVTLLSPSWLTAVSHSFSGNVNEWNAYLGLPLLAIAVATALRFRRDVLVVTCAVSAAVVLVLSLGPTLHVAGHDTGIPLPWALVQRLPLVGELLPGRLAQVVSLFVAVLLAVFVDRVVLASPRSSRVPAVAVAATLVTLAPATALPVTAASVPAFFTGPGVERIPEGSVALLLPYSHDWTSSEPMLWQVAAGFRFRMPEGYFTGPGDGHAIAGPPRTALSSALIRVAAGEPVPEDAAAQARYMADLRRWQVSTVVLGPDAHGAALGRFVSALLGRAPAEVDGVSVWWNVAGQD